MTIQDRVQNVVAAFQPLSDWEDRYKKLIEWGKALPELPEDLKTEEAKVKGCQSQVWIHARMDGDKVIFQADSDALLVRGLVALLLKVYSGSTPAEILQLPPDFVRDIGLENKLSPSRANGLFSMIKQIKFFAIAFSAR